jgi:hypothetical protein
VICAPALLPEVFSDSPEPVGPISDAAAEILAAILLESVEAEQGGDDE